MRCHFKLVWEAALWVTICQKRQLNEPYFICRLSFSRSHSRPQRSRSFWSGDEISRSVVELYSVITLKSVSLKRSPAQPSWAVEMRQIPIQSGSYLFYPQL